MEDRSHNHSEWRSNRGKKSMSSLGYNLKLWSGERSREAMTDVTSVRFLCWQLWRSNGNLKTREAEVLAPWSYRSERTLAIPLQVVNVIISLSVLSKSRVRGIKLRCILLRLCAINITFNVTLKNIFRLSWALRFFLSTWSLWGRRTVWMPQGKESLHYQVRIFGLISVTAAGHPFVKQWKHDRKAA